jgi:hypothetical protein
MVKLGIIENEIAKEMTEIIDAAWDLDFADYTLGDTEVQTTAVQGARRRLNKWSRRAHKFSSAAYQLGDQIPKMAGFMANMELLRKADPSMSEADLEKEAAERVKNQYPTYSRVGKAFKTLRKWPLHSTFPTWYAEMWRTTFHTIKQAKADIKSGNTHLKRHGYGTLARLSAASYVLQYSIGAISNMIFGIDDEELEALARHQPPWSRYSTHIYWRWGGEKGGILPWNWSGEVKSLDITYMSPYLMFMKPLNALLDPGLSAYDAVKEMSYQAAEPFISKEMVSQKLATLLGYKDREGDIYNAKDSDANIITDIIAHVSEPWVPGTITQFGTPLPWPGLTKGGRIWKGFAGYESRSGMTYSGPLELLAGLTGTRIHKMDIKNSMKYKAADFNRGMTESNNLVMKSARSLESGSIKGIAKKYRAANKARENMYHQAYLDVQALRDDDGKPLSKGKKYQMLTGYRISKANAALILRDDYSPLTLTTAQVRVIAKSKDGREKLKILWKEIGNARSN